MNPQKWPFIIINGLEWQGDDGGAMVGRRLNIRDALDLSYSNFEAFLATSVIQ